MHTLAVNRHFRVRVVIDFEANLKKKRANFQELHDNEEKIVWFFRWKNFLRPTWKKTGKIQDVFQSFNLTNERQVWSFMAISREIENKMFPPRVSSCITNLRISVLSDTHVINRRAADWLAVRAQNDPARKAKFPALWHRWSDVPKQRSLAVDEVRTTLWNSQRRHLSDETAREGKDHLHAEGRALQGQEVSMQAESKQ